MASHQQHRFVGERQVRWPQDIVARVASQAAFCEEEVVVGHQARADPGVRGVLEASGIELTLPVLLRANGTGALDTALAQLATQIMIRLYAHLNIDVIDAGYSKANELAPTAGRLPDELPMRGHDLARFDVVAAGIASYDPRFDSKRLIRDLAVGFLASIASARS